MKYYENDEVSSEKAKGLVPTYILLFFLLYIFLFPHELIADLRRLIVRTKETRRSQRTVSISGPVRNIHGRMYRLCVEDGTWKFMSSRGIKGWREREKEKHRLVIL